MSEGIIVGATMKTPIKLFCAAAMLLCGQQAWADYTWTLGTIVPSPNETSVGNSITRTFTVDGQSVTATVTGWSDAGGAIDPAILQQWDGGLGVANSNEGATVGSPNHAIDNEGSRDMVRISFTTPVNLAAFQINWNNSSLADMTVMAYQGGSANPDINPLASWTAVASAGWTVVGNYADVGTGPPPRGTYTSVLSSHWLIGTYNGLSGTCRNSLGGAIASGNCDDQSYAKLYSLVLAKPQQTTPEPGSLALLGMAMAGMVLLMGKRRRA